MKYVTTPNGQMRLSGLGRIWGAILINILLAVLALSILSALTGLFRQYGELTGMFMAPVVYFYALLAYWDKTPNLGNWALALRRYEYREVEEYTGEGALFVVESLPRAIAALRVAGAVLLLFLLYALIQLL